MPANALTSLSVNLFVLFFPGRLSILLDYFGTKNTFVRPDANSEHGTGDKVTSGEVVVVVKKIPLQEKRKKKERKYEQTFPKI